MGKLFDVGLFKKALATYGADAQLDMVVEESSELIKAIMKANRNGYGEKELDAIVDEVDSLLIDEARTPWETKETCWKIRSWNLCLVLYKYLISIKE